MYIFVGDGILKNEIKSKIKAKGLQDSIILKPFTREIDKEYLNASIYVMSSYFEGFPMVLLEASSYGLPAIAFDINTGPSDIIKDSQSGFLIGDNDLQSFAEKLAILISDATLLKNMGIQAKKRVEEKFSKEVIMGLWKEVLEK